MTTQDLISLGLQEKEAELYMACIEHGPSKAKDIAKYTSLNRGTTYDLARSLMKKGLLSTTQKRNITHFVAMTPNKYIRQLDAETEAARALMPAIEALLKTGSYRPTIKFFEGSEGIKQVYEETLNCTGKEIVCMVSVQEILDAVGADFLNYYTKKRVRRHIHLRCLKDPSGEVDEYIAGYSSGTDALALREAYLGPEVIDIAGNFMIFDDTVALMSTKRENFGVLLHSHEFAVMFRHIFNSLWLSCVPTD